MISYERWREAQSAEREYWLQQKKKKGGRNASFWNLYILKPFMNLLAPHEKRVIVDVGCGPAGLINFIDGQEKVGVEPLANHYRRYFGISPKVQMIKAIGENLPLKNEVADVAICIDVVNHVKSPEKVLTEVKRILHRHGLFIFQVNLSTLTSEVWHRLMRAYDIYHPHRFTSRIAERMLRLVGFQCIKIVYEHYMTFNTRHLLDRIGFIFSEPLFAKGVRILARRAD